MIVPSGFNPGTDTSTFAADGTVSLGLDRPEITGVRVVLEQCARTIMTPLGALFWDTSQGVIVPVQKLLNATPTDADLRRIEANWSVACVEQVEYVTAARWRILRDRLTGKLLSFVGAIDIQQSTSQVISGTLAGTAADALAFLFPTGAS